MSRRLATILAVWLTMASQVHADGAGATRTVYLGADLSYVNELDDCGTPYRDGNTVVDAYRLFAGKGANLVRLRLWHSPGWTEYSTLPDVERSIRRAKEAGMQVLLDFHYSDDWADPGDQIIPEAWAGHKTVEQLAAAVYDYTIDVLVTLGGKGLMPDIVQVGNETNTEILLTANVPEDTGINWTRNALLLNAGIAGVSEAGRLVGKLPLVMLHIAQPENAEPWFDHAFAAGILDFDLIGLSYYPKWSSRDMAALGQTIRRLRHKYAKDVIVVETAYPWTLQDNDGGSNILGADSLAVEYPASLSGQKQFLLDLTQTVLDNDGSGVVYWEPAWVSTTCETRWGKGSHWENNAFFDYDGNRAHSGFDFLSHDYAMPVEVSFTFRLADDSDPVPLYFWASFFEGNDFTVRLEPDERSYQYRARLPAGQVFRYQLFRKSDLKQSLIAGSSTDGFKLASGSAGPDGTAIVLDISLR